MTVRLRRGTFALAVVLSSAGCVTPIYKRHDTTEQQFVMDRARCQLTANMATHNQDHTSVFSPVSSNLGASIADGIIEGAEQAQNFRLCMTAIGYERVQ